MATFTTSQKGGQKLIHQGFIYTKLRDGASQQIYWRCEQWRTKKCPGFAITKANEVNVTKEHNHGASPNRIELTKIKSRIKEAASTSNFAPRALVNQQLAGISDQAKATLPKLVNLEKTVSRKRRANGEQIRIPHSLAEINIPERLNRTKTTAREEFLLFDTGAEDNERFNI